MSLTYVSLALYLLKLTALSTLVSRLASMPPVTWLSAGTRTWRLNALATSTATDVATPTAMYNCVCNSFWRHCWKRFLLSVSMLQSRCLCLSVCLSRSCIVFKRQKISTRFLLHTTAHVSPGLRYVLACIINAFFPKFCLKVTHFLLIWTSETFNGKLRPNG